MLENWHTTAFSHPHFATALLHAPTSGIDESLIIRLSLLFQKSKNPHAAFWMLLHWSGAKDPSALKTLADRVADVASTMQGSTEPMLGHEIAKLIRERVWAWERELNMGTLIEQDERLEAGERELEELERIAAERMGEIERVVEEVKRLEVEGLVAFQRKEYVAEKREKRGRILGDGVDTVERQHTYDSDETAVNSGEVSSEEESGSGTGRKLELLMKQSFEAFQDESDSESMVLPPCCSPPPPPPSSYFEASSIFTRRENSGDSAAASEIDFDPSVLVLLNQSSDNRVSISKHFSKDVDVDSSFEDLNGYKSIRRESVDSIADNVSILSLSSVTSTALFSPLTPHTNRLRPTSSCPTANDHTVSGFFDYLYTPQASPTTPVAPSNSATYEKDWNQDEDIHEEHSANDEPERAEEKWIASVAHWEYDNWKKQVFKMKNAYVELPSPTTADGGSFDGCMKLAPRDEFETDATGGVGAGPFGGSFEDEEGEDKGKGVLGGLLKRFKSTGGKAQLQKRQAELNARSEQEFCWDEEVVKGGDVDGDTVVASVLIVRDVAGSIINSTIYPRRL
ncbi:hypothetical protein BCR33DRAFT_468752 [Rhizoclosmatium globosum]|uniref:Uncharacterized protein n=1 Tax=Rhizoclosmatium globosum TaxID=329046 RepID=A0A1Y2BQL4_9FUNG|nr:hypothetical protein BCR33DRAFT_468752 [Rhizoclosmatium globosum]|eukprot:ORY37036.1 hypothetical protein BCR33DRAFT_468752 [Rhizoclosmatium globosum]